MASVTPSGSLEPDNTDPVRQSPDEGTGFVSDAEGITRVALPAGKHISSALAQSAAQVAAQLAAGKPRPVMVDITGILSIDREARNLIGRATSASAVAIVGSSPVDRVVGNFILGAEPPDYPVQFFSAAAEALLWLDRYRDGT